MLDYFIKSFLWERMFLFPVYAQDLLVVREDPHLVGSGAVPAENEPVSDYLAALQDRFEPLPFGVEPHRAEQMRFASQRGKVAGHVGCAPGNALLVFPFEHLDRRFRGDSIYRTPNIGVQHHVPDYQHLHLVFRRIV